MRCTLRRKRVRATFSMSSSDVSTVELFVQFAFANVFINDFVQRTHICQVLCQVGRQLLTF